jgi:hypothetical protein
MIRLKKEIPISLYEASHSAKELSQSEVPCVREEMLGNGEVVCLSYWPRGKRAAFNLNFDDLCPLYSHGVDFGGSPHSGINTWLIEFLEAYPEVKVTHFVIPHADPRFCGKLKNTEALAIADPCNRKWLAWLQELNRSGRVEIAAHGLSHYNEDIRIRRHAEFAFTREADTRRAINLCREIFDAAKLVPTGFRQPGWDMAADLHLVDVVADYGFIYLAGSAPGAGLNYGRTRVPNNCPARIRSLVSIPQNVELGMPLDSALERVNQLVLSGSLVSLKGHYTNMKHIRNSLSSFARNNAEKILAHLRERFDGLIWFATLGEISERFAATHSVSIAQPRDGLIELLNTASRPLRALGVKRKSQPDQEHVVDLAPGERKVVTI